MAPARAAASVDAAPMKLTTPPRMKISIHPAGWGPMWAVAVVGEWAVARAAVADSGVAAAAVEWAAADSDWGGWHLTLADCRG